MKHKSLVLLVTLLAVSLSACKITYLKSKTITSNLYSLIGQEVKNNKSISYEVLEGKELLPYFSIRSYLSLIEDYFKDGYEIYCSGYSETVVYVKNEEKENIFVASITPSIKTVFENGDFSSAFTFSKDYSKSSLYACNDNTYEIVVEPTSLRDFSYSRLSFSTFSKKGETYYPLSLLENIS